VAPPDIKGENVTTVRATLSALVLVASALGCSSAPTKFERADSEVRAVGLEMQATWNRPEFAELRKHTALSDSEITPSMTVSEDWPTRAERDAMLLWADRLSQFQPRQRTIAQSGLPAIAAAYLLPIVEAYDQREIELAKSIYQGQLTWGQYNTFRLESQRLKRRQASEVVTMFQLAGAQAAAAQPPSTQQGPSAIELFLLQRQQQPQLPTVCTSYLRGQWITTTCN